jgi:crotonobetainyl-CoA:carnitine CoA-transferase CaiB-like acyl-CoA transferase
MTDSRLPVVLLWHMHQPPYRDALSGRYVLPWTWLHAIKDYTDMAAHLENVPGIPGGIRVPGLGFKFAGEDMAPKSPPPRLGQDTEAVLRRAGYASEQIDELRAARVI